MNKFKHFDLSEREKIEKFLRKGRGLRWIARIFINQRPKKVLNRLEFGHFEGDFIESGKDGKGSLLVLVERKTRYPFIAYLEDRNNNNVNRMF